MGAQEAALFALEPEGVEPEPKDTAYRVLARKYRPQRFSDVIGQETTVTLLQKGIQRQKLGHGFLFTGIRGVGKTTLARLLAKALSCTGDRGESAEPCGVCESCQALDQGRHFDIIEMDAASNTGVDDMREVIESSRYRAFSGHYKIFIIDEVHMLSKSAFNALLKTLEEPPSHVKFIFATTEIQRVPATIISRCLRFDLKRILPQTLQDHLQTVCQAEGFQAEEKALWALAKAGDGSVRDALSMLDQAMLLALESADKTLTLQMVQDMLGLVDPKGFFELFQHLLKGNVEDVLRISRELYQAGADPFLLLDDLLTLCHQTSLHHLAPDLSAAQWTDPETLAFMASITQQDLSFGHISRVWQMLLKGREELRAATLPFHALEMVLARIAHMAHFPTPEDLVKQLSGGGGPPTPLAPKPEKVEPQPATPAPKPSLASFEDLVKLASARREGLLYTQLMEHVHPLDWTWGKLSLQLTPKAPEDLITRLKHFLKQETGTLWQVETASVDSPPPTLGQRAKTRREVLIEQALANPLIKKAQETFPGMTLHDTEIVIGV